MLMMKVHRTPSISEYPMLTTDDLREGYMLEDLFESGVIQLVYTDVDRAIVGTACPKEEALVLEVADELRSDYFCERRELGIINIGAAAGKVTVDGDVYELDKVDMLYVGRGSKEVLFEGADARFYMVSYPAHAAYPTKKIAKDEANKVELGSKEEANERTIRQYIHEGGAKSCQLVMGWTELKQGSVWNTMPSHTHDRRSEVYTYFDVPESNAVLHLMGDPQETRSLWLHNEQSVLSPSWSIHSGCGTSNYNFVWAMGGENQRFDDMDPAPIIDMR